MLSLYYLAEGSIGVVQIFLHKLSLLNHNLSYFPLILQIALFRLSIVEK
jgi:hypothetical protein